MNFATALGELVRIASTIKPDDLAKDLSSGRLAESIEELEMVELSQAAIGLQLVRIKLEADGDCQFAAAVDLVRDRVVDEHHQRAVMN